MAEKLLTCFLLQSVSMAMQQGNSAGTTLLVSLKHLNKIMWSNLREAEDLCLPVMIFISKLMSRVLGHLLGAATALPIHARRNYSSASRGTSLLIWQLCHFPIGMQHIQSKFCPLPSLSHSLFLC